MHLQTLSLFKLGLLSLFTLCKWRFRGLGQQQPSIWITPCDVSVTFLFALVKVHRWFMKEVCQNASYGQFTTKNTKNSDPTLHFPQFVPYPHSKILGTPLLCPVLKMKSRRLCIYVSCHFVCILLSSFCDHCKNVW